MYRRVLIFVYMCSSFCAFSGADYPFPNLDTLVHTTHAKRTIAFSNFYEEGIRYLDSVEVFKRISRVERVARKSSDKDLLLEAELMRAHYYCYRDYFDRNYVVRIIKKLERKAISQNVLWLEIRAKSLLGNYLYYMQNDYAEGFNYLVRTAQLVEKLPAERYPLKQIHLYQVGSIYITFKEHDEGKKYLMKALRASSKHDRYYYKMHILNTLGIYFYQKKVYDSADYYFNKTLSNARLNNDSVWEAETMASLGGTQYYRGNYVAADSLLEQAISIDAELERYSVRKHVIWINALLQLSEFNEAQRLGDQLRSTLEQYSTVRTPEAYSALAKLAAYRGEGRLSADYISDALNLKDTLAKTFDAKLLLREKQRIAYEQNKLKREKERRIQRERLFWRNGIIVGLALLLVIVLLVYNRYRLKAKNRQQQIAFEKAKAEQSLERAELQLDDFRMAIRSKNDVISKFTKELEETKEKVNSLEEQSSNEISIAAKKEAILQLQGAAILTEQDWREFVEIFEKVHQGFFDRLTKKYPALSKAEIRLMALIRLGLDNKEMALMLGVGTGAIRQNKVRIRKKIASNREGVDLKAISDAI